MSGGPLLAGEEAGQFEMTPTGLHIWRNRANQSGFEGFISDYRENGFRSINVYDAGEGAIRNGGGNGLFSVEAYGPQNVDRSFTLTSYHPDLELPNRLLLPAGHSSVTTPIFIPEGAVRRNIRILVEDDDTHETRQMTLVVEPWNAPTPYIVIFRPNIVVGGTQAKLQFHFGSDTKGWVKAQLSSSSSGGIVVPAEVTMPKGKVCDIMLDTLPVASRVVRQVTARCGTVTKADYITIDPQ